MHLNYSTYVSTYYKQKGARGSFSSKYGKIPLLLFLTWKIMPVIPFVFEPDQHTPFLETSLPSSSLEKVSHNSLLVASQKSSFDHNKLPTNKNWQPILGLLTSLLVIAPEVLRDYWQNNIALDAKKSRQVIQVVRIIELGQEVFAEATYFNTWLLKPAYGFAGRLPLELFYTEGGIDLIADELMRIAYGDAIL